MKRPVVVWILDPEVRVDGGVEYVRMTYRLKDGRTAHQYVPVPPSDQLTRDLQRVLTIVERDACIHLPDNPTETQLTWDAVDRLRKAFNLGEP